MLTHAGAMPLGGSSPAPAAQLRRHVAGLRVARVWHDHQLEASAVLVQDKVLIKDGCQGQQLLLRLLIELRLSGGALLLPGHARS